MNIREAKVVGLLKAIETKDADAMSLIDDRAYIQHNLYVPDGPAGFRGLVASLPDGLAKVSTKRVFQDGDYVVAHSEIDIGGAKAVFDIFRFEGDYVVEHWDNAQLLMPANPSGRSLLDGRVEIVDIDCTAANKLVARAFVENILMVGDLSRAKEFVSAQTYIQHHPMVRDGLDGLAEAFGQWAEEGVEVAYSKVHMVLGKGNFALVVSGGRFNDNDVAFYDMFRLADGKIVEHWDVVEEIPARDTWQNSNGKF